MNSDIKVSVIIPVYNEKKHLFECINSVCNQIYTNLEIILVDDGSTNGAEKDCDLFAARDERIRVIHKENGGLSAARITGLHAATGSWIMFMDHDDLLSAFALERFVRETYDSDVDIITGGRIDFENAMPVFPDKDCMPLERYTGKAVCEKLAEDRQKTIITPLWGKIYRATFLKNLNLEQYKDQCPIIFFEDILMTPILYSKARYVIVIHREMYAHREVKNSISRSGKLSQFYYDQVESGSILIEYVKEKNLEKYYQYILGIYMLTILRIYCLMDYDMEVNSDYKEKMRIKIIDYYNKYFDAFFEFSTMGMIKKIVISGFRISPNLWKKIVYKLYFNRQ